MKHMFSAILILGLLSGCTPSTIYEVPSEKWNVWSQPPSPPIKMTLSLSDNVVTQGQPVQLTLNIRNISTDSLFLIIGGAQGYPQYDFIATLPDTTFVWSRLSDGNRALDLTAFSQYLGPDDTLSYQYTWQLNYTDGPLLPEGLYQIYGGIKADLVIGAHPFGDRIEGDFATSPVTLAIHE